MIFYKYISLHQPHPTTMATSPGPLPPPPPLFIASHHSPPLLACLFFSHLFGIRSPFYISQNTLKILTTPFFYCWPSLTSPPLLACLLLPYLLNIRPLLFIGQNVPKNLIIFCLFMKLLLSIFWLSSDRFERRKFIFFFKIEEVKI